VGVERNKRNSDENNPGANSDHTNNHTGVDPKQKLSSEHPFFLPAELGKQTGNPSWEARLGSQAGKPSWEATLGSQAES
jgi:hypothetical protein